MPYGQKTQPQFLGPIIPRPINYGIGQRSARSCRLPPARNSPKESSRMVTRWPVDRGRESSNNLLIIKSLSESNIEICNLTKKSRVKIILNKIFYSIGRHNLYDDVNLSFLYNPKNPTKYNTKAKIILQYLNAKSLFQLPGTGEQSFDAFYNKWLYVMNIRIDTGITPARTSDPKGHNAADLFFVNQGTS